MYKYNFIQVEPSVVVEQDSFTPNDIALLESFEVNSSYNQSKDFIELHYYTLDGRLLKSFENYTNIQTSQDSETSNQESYSTILLRTEDDLKIGGYDAGDVYLYYNFLTDPYSKDKSKIPFFIEEISPDRLEVRLLTTKLSNELIVEYTKALKELVAESDSTTLLLNLGSNRHLLSTNIDTLPYEESISVVLRLYNPLPDDLIIKDQLFINRVVSNPVTYLAEAVLIEEEKKREYLKGPNFNIYEGKTTSSPTQYLNIEDIFSYPVTNTYFEVKSLYEEKGIQLSIDYSDYNNFINFSSAEERLRNFKYKFDLIQSYESQSNNVTNINSFSTGSTEYFDGLINNIISNFDHYDRFLYFESSSYSWPKSGNTKPYIPLTGSATGSWYTTQLTSASFYDSTNSNLLTNTVPEFLREDPNNTKYTTFVHMIGQHFDNLWIYAKGVTDKYNADNRLDSGISKQLIEDALKNFGVRLYNSNRSSQELFRMFTGESYDTGSESYVDEVITASNQVISEEDYRRQIYKRLYHNLPLLLKSKGTERGIRALLSSFGIPSFYSSGSYSGINIIRQGGTSTQSSNLGNLTSVSSSLDKIRLDDTGSIVGTTLSQYVSIEKRDYKYSKDTNKIQIGYSPADFLNEYIIASASLDGFNIDSILGDPDTAYSSSYTGLKAKATEYLTPTTGSRYNLKDFTRILKFYDNILFKTVNDFTPARDSINTGVIIKPHFLDRSKAKQVRPSYQRHNDFSSSISVQTTTGSEGGAFGSRNQYSASYVEYFMTSGGLASSEFHSHEQAKFDGEFSGSYIKISNGELNDENTFKYFKGVNLLYAYDFINGDADCEIIWGEFTPSTPGPTPSPTVTPSITPTISVTPTVTSTPGLSTTPTPTITPTITTTPTITPTITPTPTNTPPFVQQYTEFYIDSTGYSSDTDACNNAVLGTPVYFTSSIGTSFSDLITTVQGGTPVAIYTDSSLTTAFTSTTLFHAADSTGPTATYALLVNSIGDVGAAQACNPPTLTPTPTPSRQLLLLRNDGSSYPNGGFNTSNDACTSGVASVVPFGYVEAADNVQPLALNTQVYLNSTGATVFDGGDKYWLSEDQTYAYRIGANGLVSQAVSCVAATPTPTPTLPPVQQWSDFYVHTTEGNGDSSEITACGQTTLSTRLYFTSSVGDFSDYVTNFGTLSTLEKRVYNDDALTDPFEGATLYYGADQTGLDTSYALLIQSNGDVGLIYDCSTPLTPTPTPTPSRQLLQLRNDGSSYPNGGFTTSNDACTSGVASIVPFGYVEAADNVQPLAINTQVYRDSTGATVFDGGDKYWLSEDQTYAYRIGANGLVSQAVSCVAATPTPTPTPTSTPVSTVTISLAAAQTESATWPEYQVTINITGAKSTTRTLQQTSSTTVVDTFDLFTTGIYDGTGTITISRTSPDNTVVDGAQLSVSQLNGYSTSPTDKTFTADQVVSNESFTISGFAFGDEIDITITEG